MYALRPCDILEVGLYLKGVRIYMEKDCNDRGAFCQLSISHKIKIRKGRHRSQVESHDVEKLECAVRRNFNLGRGQLHK